MRVMGAVSIGRKAGGLLGAVLLATGCEREEVRVYDVPKQPPTATVASAGALPPGHPPVGDGHAPVGSLPQIDAATPPGWQPAPKGEFRVLSYRINGPDGTMADVSVIPLPAMPEGDVGNVNRWRAQVGLPAVSAEEITQAARRIEIAGAPADLYELPGETLTVLGAIQHRDGVSWYYKMTGHRELVAEQRQAFLDFLKSVRLGSAPAVGRAVTAARGEAAGESSSAGRPRWNIPAGWTETEPGAFLVAKFILRGERGETGQVNISSSRGDGGGLIANINRWRQQLGLPAWSAQELARAVREVQTKGGPAVLVELESADTSVLGAIVTRPDETWFYKLTAPPTLAAAQREMFWQFVREVEY